METGRLYFITFSTYGTRLLGREAGSRRWDSQYIEPNEALYNYMSNRLNEPCVQFSSAKRALVHDSFMETSRRFGWEIDALNVREDHVHIVIFTPGGKRPDEIVRKLKTGATYALYNAGRRQIGSRVWTKMFSSTLGWDIGFWRGVISYTLEEQGENKYLYESRFGQACIRQIRANQGRKKYTLYDFYGGRRRASVRAAFFQRLAKQSAAERLLYVGNDYTYE